MATIAIQMPDWPPGRDDAAIYQPLCRQLRGRPR
jgi:hypothetical protein